jgi:hypothetical protein
MQGRAETVATPIRPRGGAARARTGESRPCDHLSVRVVASQAAADRIREQCGRLYVWPERGDAAAAFEL